MDLKEIFFIIFSYLIGCFSGAYYYGIIFKKVDLRKLGSGNLGALNAGRVLGQKDFLVVFLIDFLKGAMVVFIAQQLNLRDSIQMMAMISVVLGHILPLQLHFQGGKGIATFLGVITVFDITVVLILLLIYLPVFVILRQFTISGLISIGLLPLVLFFLDYSGEKVLVILLFAIIIITKHRKNILDYQNFHKKRNH
ncbi:glycerol-3-phosphate acyltransferase [Dehalobacterium formicoaceticum]|uniref:Glycerol-3-phosphate acyltransferase n=1 Tax=Dehalobacterium formicoaceticum TaxID=51515 RepID=A0ABT1Y2W5_9FIRM|nr:glycerol-3-phosphate acyltransferase [Dehalobacterium formicoaceticum]MCR6545204.1 glycerol-3-phosphate acyltransferase [Dehalobacterium formicoaceticum]